MANAGPSHTNKKKKEGKKKKKFGRTLDVTHGISGDAYRTEPGRRLPPTCVGHVGSWSGRSEAERQTELTAAKSDSCWPPALLGRSDQLEEEDGKLFGSSCCSFKEKKRLTC